MKKTGILWVLLALCLLLEACGARGGTISPELEVLEAQPSELYTKQEIAAAMETVKTYFHREFSGCTLTALGFAGDAACRDHAEWAQRIDGDQVIVLTSSFDVDSSGGDGSLNPDSTYTRWRWILARSDGGPWQHVDHGY